MSKLVNYRDDAVIVYGPDDIDWDYQAAECQTEKTENDENAL